MLQHRCFLSKFAKIFKNTYFEEHLGTTALMLRQKSIIQWQSGFKNNLSEVDKFFSRRPNLRASNFTCALDRARKTEGQNRSVRSIETQLETLLYVLYHLNRTCSFLFKCVSIKSFCNEAFVIWLLFQCLK